MSETAIIISANVDINTELKLDEIDEYAVDAITQFYERFIAIVVLHKEKLEHLKRKGMRNFCATCTHRPANTGLYKGRC